jgi:dTDP-4-amino-4,6-dideoxygalactose transaminase
MTERTRAVIPVHLGGMPCAMDEIAALAEASDLLLIEDCAQAHGATYRGRPVGSFGDAAVFSFCTDKIMSTGGEGGMILLRDHSLWEHVWSLSNHGKDYAIANLPAASFFRWVHEGFGSNYRMTEMQAAIGLRQLEKLPGWVAARRRNAATLLEALDGVPALRLIHPTEDFGHAYYSFYAFVNEEELAHGWSRDRIIEEMRAVRMPCQSGICPEIYRETAFKEAGYAPPRRLPVARALGRTSLKLPVDHTLSSDDMRTLGQSLRSIALAASR